MRNAALDPAALAAELIRRPSVTPKDEGAIDIVASHLEDLGFTCHRLVFGGDDGSDAIVNLYARRGEGRPNLCFAGHTDVVPPGAPRGVVARPVRRRLARRRAVGPRCGRHEGRDRRVYRCRPALARRTRAGLGRLDQPPDHRRRGSRGDQRHQESARMVGGARREARCLSRRRADFGQRPRRHDQDRPARQPDRAADRAWRAGPHRLPAARRQCRPSPGGDVACPDQRRTRPRVRAFPAFDPCRSRRSTSATRRRT